ncbi:MAG: DUF998 domain-containing protein [Candidatus Bathyarchaeota archaeon]|nr:DUF998 domain-containing protein [Candidatus Bathyarchaeota archaeon]
MSPKHLYLQIGGAAGVATPIIAFTCITIAIVTYPSFSWTNNALSDLGVVPGITGPLFNSGLCLSGVLAFIFATIGLFNYFQSIAGKVGSAVFAGATIALIAIGVFNENFSPTHYWVSVAFFVLAPIALFILTCSFALERKWGLAAFSVLIGLVAALPWVLQLTINYVPHVAIPETISAVAVSAWAIVLSIKMLQKIKR